MNVGHGDYTFRNGKGRDVYQIMSAKNCIAYCEFGVPGPSSPAYIADFIPEEYRAMPVPDSPWQDHHAFHKYMPLGWLQLYNMEHYFGKLTDYETIYERGSWLQTEGYKAIFEEARRQKPVCGMALNWCYNEPWPTAANNSILNYPALPKPGFFGVKDALRPVLASAAILKFDWRGGETFQTTLWLLNDQYLPIPQGTIRASIKIDDQLLHLGDWQYPAPQAGKNLKGINVECVLPSVNAEYMELVLDAGAFSSCYKLKYTK